MLQGQERHASSLTECLIKESSQQVKWDYKHQIIILIVILLILSLKIFQQYQHEMLIEDVEPFDYNETLAMCSINTTFGIDIFNRGRLFNAGFKEVMKLGKWQCVIFHDVDLLPLDDRILYTCPIWPRNMCGTIVEEKDPTFRTLYGGVSAMDVKHFSKVNGYSNSYWGWGGEDDDIYKRLHEAGIPVTKYDKQIALYTSLRHVKQAPNKNRYKLLRTALKRSKKDGISSLKFKVISVTLLHLYTHLVIDINPKKENVQEIYFK
ncbi:unnamed protein product [Pieris brassicae]|uniref:Galactosyltransferase C-terminal domain-containing protein n=1 Tax=Pieris brassicae TaxID=7116 RepID=A0A9P0TKM7_PIEBR|nr:unnamed protein product [Pieris brassicae]